MNARLLYSDMNAMEALLLLSAIWVYKEKKAMHFKIKFFFKTGNACWATKHARTKPTGCYGDGVC